MSGYLFTGAVFVTIGWVLGKAIGQIRERNRIVQEVVPKLEQGVRGAVHELMKNKQEQMKKYIINSQYQKLLLNIEILALKEKIKNQNKDAQTEQSQKQSKKV